MSSSRIPGGISDAGQAFMDAMPPAIACPADAEAIAKIRQQGHEEFIPRADRAVECHRIRWQSIQINGIECIEAVAADNEELSQATLLYFYGGGYVYGDAYDDLCISAALCRHTGARVVAPQYRLAPENPWPAPVDDGYAVYRHLIESLDPQQITVAGESAGGNLSLAVINRAITAGLAAPAALALMSPWCDLTPLDQQIETGVVLPQDPTLHHDDLDHFARSYAGDHERHEPDISPLYTEYDDRFPRTMITSATRDMLMPQCVRLANKMLASGVEVDLRIYPGLCHVFECYDEIPEADHSLKALSGFLYQQ